MSDTLAGTTGPDSTGPGSTDSRSTDPRNTGARSTRPADDGSTVADTAHGRHRGLTAPDDRPAADPHGRHRLGAAERT